MGRKKQRDKTKKRPRRRSVLGTMIWGQILLICGSFLVVYVIFNRFSVREYSDSSCYYNQISMDMKENMLEERLGEKWNRMRECFQDPDINTLVASGSRYGREEMTAAVLSFQRWLEEQSGLMSSRILIRDSGLMMRSDGSVTRWDEDEEQKEVAEFLLKGDPVPPIITEDVICLYVNFPEEHPLAVIEAVVSKEWMKQELEQVKSLKSSWPSSWYDEKGVSVFSDGPLYTADTILVKEKETSDYPLYHMKDAKNQLIMRQRSESTGWYLVSYSERSTILPGFARIFQTVLPCLILLFIFINVVCLTLIHKIYPPLNQIVKGLEDKYPTDHEDSLSGNELDMIHGALEENAKETRELRQLVETASSSILQDQLKCIVLGKSTDKRMDSDTVKKLQYRFLGNDYFQLILFRCQMREGKNSTVLEEEMSVFETRQRLKAFWEERCQAELLVFDNRVQGLVLGYGGDVPAAQIRRNLTQMETWLQSWNEKQSFCVIWGNSEICAGWEALNGAYHSAERVLNRNYYYWSENRNREKADNSAVHLYRVQFCQYMEHLIGGEPGAVEELQGLQKEIIRRSEEEQQECYRTIYDCAVERMVQLQLDISHFQEWKNWKNSQTGDAVIESLFEQVIHELSGSGYREQYRYVEGAKRYVQTHFSNSMLSLDIVSEHLGISSSYLSTLFTRFLNMGFVEYLNRCRLERAAKLLEYTEISISEIGLQSGFNSLQNFGRVFRKYYGISPSAFRKQCQDKDKDTRE
ncbi:MAG: helix-turn-helix transcriptional regulator [Clostridiales bacterium]|nr:helix-turn-helix transcriptional regulator [Clostridiales bacterium]